ncbi:MAG: DUF2281 domain-containing protein [Methanophagales archaeon]|nr:DUF2281 domain-containing protein [Methanophagales archaeon]
MEIRKKVEEKIETLPEDVLKPVLDFIEYVKDREAVIKQFELKYGLFSKLKGKIMNDEHSWEEESDFFEWEAAITEIDKLKRIFGIERK